MIVLPWPSSDLAGHSSKHYRTMRPIIAKHREWAHNATLEVNPAIPAEGDILVHVRFVPANNRGDRLNYANRMKPYFDGIADALKVNDKRFLPSFTYSDPEKPGRVEVTICA